MQFWKSKLKTQTSNYKQVKKKQSENRLILGLHYLVDYDFYFKSNQIYEAVIYKAFQ